MIKKFIELYNYRQMIFSLVGKELRSRYKGSVLGFLWTFINPLLQLGVYTLLFSVILKSDIEKYYIFLFVGLVPWIFFSTCLSAGCSCILFNANLITKIYFPREVMPVSFVTSAFVNMLYSFIVVLAVIIFTGYGINILALLCLPLFFIIEYILSLGITLILCSITVYIRDFAHIMGILTMLLQFLSPVMYSSSRIPENLRPIFNLNPMAPVLEGYRQILYYKHVPDFSTLGSSILFALILIAIGEFIFSALQKGFAEEL